MSQKNPFERFTNDARVALQVAEKTAQMLKSPRVGTEHLLMAILENPQSLAFSTLHSTGVSLENVKLLLPNITPETSDPNFPSTLSNLLREAIEKAVDIAVQKKHNFVGSEHLLMAILQNPNCNAVKIFELMSIFPEHFLKQIDSVLDQLSPNNTNKKTTKERGGKNIIGELLNGIGAIGMMKNPFEEEEKPYKKSKKSGAPSSNEEEFDDEFDSDTPALDFFSVDFSQMAKEEEIDPIIGRDKEIERVIHILNRKTKNNPVLLGEPGVGKTAVVEGLAQRIYEGEVPTGLLGKRVLSLDISSMIAGTKYRGEFEERLKEVIEDAIDSQGEVIIFIDEIHTIVGAGGAEGSLDAANILKPALSRGKIQVIGATTFDEYRKKIEKDKALERRFQSVIVDEPSEEDALEIMHGVASGLASFHRLDITPEAVKASVQLSSRYITERFLPDKAIDLLDESCAGKGHKSQKKSEELRKIEEQIKTLSKKKEESVKNQNYEKALKWKNEIEKHEKALSTLRTQTPKGQKKVSITEEHIAQTVSKITGIPLKKMVSKDAKKLLDLENILRKKVVGQSHAIEEISKAIRRARVGIGNPNKPMGSFLFLGPTGVGKTELVRVLAEEVYGRKENLIKIDMSEFMERHSTSRLVGATAGYVGYEDGGELTEKVRRNPYSIVLFDEIEKAHTDFQNILLQIFEDGYLTDSKGRKVDFRNTIIIMTSNIGAEILTEEATKIGFSMAQTALQKAEENFEEQSNLVIENVRKHFKPEFIGRLDKMIIFKPLTKKSIRAIVKISMKELEQRLESKQIHLEYTDSVTNFLAKKAFDSKNGGRKVRQVVQTEVEDLITEKILEEKIHEGSTVKIVCKRGKSEGLDIKEG